MIALKFTKNILTMAGAAEIQFGQLGKNKEKGATSSTMWMEDDGYAEITQLPPEVLKAIEQVLPSDDPLDQSEFDIVAHINTLFPTEQSLAQLNDVIQSVEQDIYNSDQEIREFVRHQTGRGGQDGVTALTRAQASIEALVTKVLDMKGRAEQSEAAVRDMTRDIRQLDTAKRNLTAAITTLNHLNMLLSGVDTLQTLVKTRQYGDVANLLQGVANVVEHFDNYHNIPQIAELAQKVKDIKKELGDQISLEFRESFSSTTGSLHVKQMSEACLVLDVLEPHVKHDLLGWFISIQLKEYGVLFDENEDLAWLDKVDKRYAWLKKHLIQFEERYGAIFPSHWDVSQRIAMQFCHQTRQDLSKVMTKRRHEIDVKLLLSAIQRTSSFENLLFLRFGGQAIEDPGDATNPFLSSNADDDEKNPFLQNNGDTAKSSAKELASPPPRRKIIPNAFHRIMAQCFDPFLYIYVESQDRNLVELIDKFVGDLRMQGFPMPQLSDSSGVVLANCADLFVYYKKCLVQCTQLSCGEPLLNLGFVFIKRLRDYCNKILQANLPKVANQNTHVQHYSELRDLNTTGLIQNFQSLLKEGEAVRFTSNELYRIACILTTAEYCVETTQQLEEKLKEKLGAHASKLSMEHERSIPRCSCEPLFTAITKTAWQSIDKVGDQSAYVSGMISQWKSTVPTLRDYLATARKYFVIFCQQFANSNQKFVWFLFATGYLWRSTSRPYKSATNLNKDEFEALLDLPSIGLTVKRKPPDKYSKLIVREMGRTEMVLKVVMAPVEQIATFVDQATKLIPDCGPNEFSKILDMKGFKKTEQGPFIETFKTKTSGISHSHYSQFQELDSPESNVESSRIKKLEKLIKKRL
ncbi:Vacuolar protein sorting-associated protein 53 [Orchesella cincta]|uniref:Vacuolar protein sorting-associated protein 53 homolog n=1 Tax=Orchesella cincta TaxID=48709 RepID=A0A1D2NBI9_ORCCI|nr:Vacuolar protein sorting-associated protein 53 [Orchesella cincta]